MNHFSLSEHAQSTAGSRSRTLPMGSLIDKLDQAPLGASVIFSHDGRAPGRPVSYEGFHEDLAFGPVLDPIKARPFKYLCRSMLGKSIEEHKGRALIGIASGVEPILITSQVQP